MNKIYDELIAKGAVEPVQATPYEIGWHLKDIDVVLEWLKEKNHVVLGGDILNKNKEHTYDNWYYEYDNNISLLDNVEKGVAKAREYTSWYAKKFGFDYFVVVVSADAEKLIELFGASIF